MKVLSMRGKEVHMDRLMAQNEKKMAIGNASMNARGDIVVGGKVVKKREEISQDYHRSPKSIKQVGLKNLASEIYNPDQEAVLKPVEAAKKIKEAIAANQPKTNKHRKISETETE